MTIAPIPVTCFTGFLGAGKTTTIVGLLKRIPNDYKACPPSVSTLELELMQNDQVVLLKNEYGDVEVDSLLASQSQITAVSEILNGCLCCTMVGLVENALLEIRDKYAPDRIIIESSGSAFPATLALQIRQLEPQGFKLDGVVTVIDCVNFRGYEDASPSAKLQARYTDLLLLSKHDLTSETQMDSLLDHLGTLNDLTPRIKVGPDNPISPEVVFGLDTRLWRRKAEEGVDWDAWGGVGRHEDEVEVRAVWRGGSKGKGKVHEHRHENRNGEECDCGESGGKDGEVRDGEGEAEVGVVPVEREVLESELAKLSFEIYRVKGIVRLLSPTSKPPFATHILNWAFGRFELTPFLSLDRDEDLRGVSMRLTVMGERGEVVRRARKMAEGLGAEMG